MSGGTKWVELTEHRYFQKDAAFLFTVAQKEGEQIGNYFVMAVLPTGPTALEGPFGTREDAVESLRGLMSQ